MRAQFKQSLTWTSAQPVQPSQILTASLGLAAPVAIGAFSGHLGAGMAAGLGGLALAGAPHMPAWRGHLKAIALDVVATTAAIHLGMFLAPLAWRALFIPLVLLAIAELSLLGKQAMRRGTMAIIFLLIAAGLGSHAEQALHTTQAFASGALLAGLLSMLLTPLCLRLGWDKPPAAAHTPPTPPMPHWRRSLTHLAGWQYGLRLAIACGIGDLLGRLWFPEHGYWVLLTTALILDRQLPASMQRSFERGAGTVIGVAVATLFAWWQPAHWLIVLLIGVLAAIRPVLKQANYMAYTVIMTPLIMLLLDLGGPADPWLTLRDRLGATLLACVLVLVLDRLVSPRLFRRAIRHQGHPR